MVHPMGTGRNWAVVGYKEKTMSKDIIYREDAIKTIAETIATDSDTSAWLYVAEDMLKGVPSADRPQGWIPCSERLPSKGVAVLANGIMYDAPPITISVDAPYYYEQGWINAWMPLPEPWKGADDEDN